MLAVIQGNLVNPKVYWRDDQSTDCLDRIRNKAKLRAIEVVDPRNIDLRRTLQKAEMAVMAGNDVVNEDEDDSGGPGSESD